MPGFTSHYIIAQKAFDDLDPGPLKSVIGAHRAVYQLGAQGPDIFFYNVVLARHGGDSIALLMHEFHIRAFFSSMLTALSRCTDSEAFSVCAAYFAGYMCHYVSDSIIHPYVYARIGHNPKHRGRRRSLTNSLHCQFENDLDAILLLRYHNKKPSDFDQAGTCAVSKEEGRLLAPFLSDAINRTYFPERCNRAYSVTNGIVARSIWATRLACRTLSDPSEKKKRRIRYIENLFGASPVASNKLVTDRISDIRKALNTVHEPWRNPWDQSIISRSSLPELFRASVLSLNQCFSRFDTLLSGAAKKDGAVCFASAEIEALLSALGSRSMHSGLYSG